MEAKAMRSILIAFMLVVSSTCLQASATAAPIPNDSPKGAGDGWASNLWPPFNIWSKSTQPAKPAKRAKEPAIVRSTRESLGAAWQGTKRTTKSAWDKTLYLLRPYDQDPKPKRSATTARREADAGFWSGLFGGKSKQEPMTVNEFLTQPTVY